MAMLPDADKEHQDFLDFLTDACKKVVRVRQKDGSYTEEKLDDWKKTYYKTHLINYGGFSNTVFETERLEGMAYDLFNHMSDERAIPIFNQIMNYVESIRYAMDGKSSEVVRGKDNTQSSMTHLMTRVRIDTHHSGMEEAKKGLGQSIFGHKDENRQQN